MPPLRARSGICANNRLPPRTSKSREVEQKDVPIYGEWIGTLDGLVNADIKAQVSGYLLKQDYTEGSFVRKGQLLFEIDPRPFQAALDQAEGQLAQAKGQLAQAQARNWCRPKRSSPSRRPISAERSSTKTATSRSRKQQAITQQDLDNATQNNLAAKAQVQAAKAQSRDRQGADSGSQCGGASSQGRGGNGAAQSRIHPAHVAHRRHRRASRSSRSALWSVRPAELLPRSPRVDPIKVYFTVSEQEYLDFNRRFPTQSQRQAEPQRLQLELILADGIVYPHKGKFFFADRQVNQDTGAIRMAGLFPNPGNILRPGQYGQGARRDRDTPRRTAGSAAGCHRTAGHLSGRRRRQREQGQHPDRQGRRPRRLDVDHRRRV